VLRRAYRLLLADDPRPLRVRLTHEARRILIAAAVTLLLGVVACIAAIVALVWILT
jgi:hypothetical protein